MSSGSAPEGTAFGLNAFAETTSPETTIDSLYAVMIEVASWVKKTSGFFLGHVKMSVTTGEFGAATLNLTDLKGGVEFHGSMVFPLRADIQFMAAVLDVNQNELAAMMEKELVSKGFKIKKNKQFVVME